MHVSNIASSATNSNTNVDGSAATGSNTSSGASSFQALLSQLTSYTSGTPSQRMETAILAQLGITQAQLQNMPPKQQEQVMEKVRELLKKELAGQQQAPQIAKGIPGVSGDLSL
jgi:type II secretory pathway component PulL